MLPALLKRLRDFAYRLRPVAVMLAIACQISAGGAFSAADNTDPQSALLAAVSILCAAGRHGSGHDAPPPHRHLADHAVVKLGSADGQSAPLLDRTPYLPEPIAGSLGKTTTLPRSRAPPAKYVSAAFPRGPPNLV